MKNSEAEQFYGGDPLVLTRPKICTNCQHGWEPKVSKAACKLMMVVSTILFAASLSFLIYFFSHPEAHDRKYIIIASSLMTASSIGAFLNYLRLVKN